MFAETLFNKYKHYYGLFGCLKKDGGVRVIQLPCLEVF